MVAQAGDLPELIELARIHTPELVVSDIRMPPSQRISGGGCVVDPGLVSELMLARQVEDPLSELSSREREVLGLMAEGRSNAGIARALWVTEGTVAKHVNSILRKLQLRASDDDHRRVLAVIAFLSAAMSR